MSSKRALVAGGAGFVGSHLCELLLERDYDVTCIDNLVTGRKKNLQSFSSSRLHFIQADINEPLEIKGPFDEIYNLASPASPVDFTRIPVFILNTASIGHRNLLEIAIRNQAKILFASSSEVYGDALVHPQQEDYFGNVNTIGPRGCYDEAKRFGESLSLAYHRQYGLQVRIARIFNTYGPRMRPTDGRIIPNFFSQALAHQPLTVYGDGSQTRSFCFVTDLAEGLYQLMQSSVNLPVNIGNPTERKVIDMAHAINKLTGNSSGMVFQPLPENDPLLRRPDITRAKSLLHWSPKVSLEDGLKASLEYFQSELLHHPESLVVHSKADPSTSVV